MFSAAEIAKLLPPRTNETPLLGAHEAFIAEESIPVSPKHHLFHNVMHKIRSAVPFWFTSSPAQTCTNRSICVIHCMQAYRFSPHYRRRTRKALFHGRYSSRHCIILYVMNLLMVATGCIWVKYAYGVVYGFNYTPP